MKFRSVAKIKHLNKTNYRVTYLSITTLFHLKVILYKNFNARLSYVGQTGPTLAARIAIHMKQKMSKKLKTCTDFQTCCKSFVLSLSTNESPSSFQKFIGRYFEKIKCTNGFSERRFIEGLLIKNLKPNLHS